MSEKLRINEFAFGNDTTKKCRGSLTVLGGTFRIVAQDKATFKWKMAILLSPIDTYIFEEMLRGLESIENDNKVSHKIEKWENGATSTIGVIHVGRSEKGSPYIRIEGSNAQGEKYTGTFPILQMPSFRPMDETTRVNYGDLTVKAMIRWMERDLPVGRALHNFPDPNAKKRFAERAAKGKASSGGGGEELPF